MIFVDTNVLVDVVCADPQWMKWSIDALDTATRTHDALVINAIVYSEFSIGFTTIEECDAAIRRFGVSLAEIPNNASFRAGRAFREYRQRGGTKTNVLPDFFIGAHASALGVPLLTRDAGRYTTYFPEVELVAPV